MYTLISTWLYMHYISAAWSFYKSARLNTSQFTESGAHLTVASYIDTTHGFYINPETQTGTDLEILLNNEWGFHSSVQSTINLSIHGFTPNITKLHGEFLILFAVNQIQYFSVAIMLNKHKPWKSYPSFQNATLATTNNIFTDIISHTSDRTNRVSNNNSWTHIGQNIYKNALQWPLNIQITNDPIQNLTHYACILPNKTLTATFTTAFDTNKKMNIYIMNSASDNTPFNIHSIDITYSYMSQKPSIIPSMYPTTAPVREREVENPETSMTEDSENEKTPTNTKKHWTSWTSWSWMKIVAIAAALFFLCCISVVIVKICAKKCCKKKPMEISKPTLNTLPAHAQIMANNYSNNIAMNDMNMSDNNLGISDVIKEEQ
eukprot:199334_1